MALIFITNHAEERILLRIKCSQDKVKKIAKKAWYSKEKIRQEFIYNKVYYRPNDMHTVYRLFLGHIFVFRIENLNDREKELFGGEYKNVLVTVHKWTTKAK